MNINRKKILIILGVLVILGLNLYNIPLKSTADQPASSASPSDPLKPNRQIDVSALNKAVNSSLSTPIDFTKYQSVLVTFWATWCPSCRRENTMYNEMSSSYQDRLLILGVSVDEDEADVTAYLKNTPLKFPSVHQTKAIAEQFDDLVAVPTHYMIDVASGRAVKTMGMMNKEELSTLLKEFVK